MVTTVTLRHWPKMNELNLRTCTERSMSSSLLFSLDLGVARFLDNPLGVTSLLFRTELVLLVIYLAQLSIHLCRFHFTPSMFIAFAESPNSI
jgi:hypothetical protein